MPPSQPALTVSELTRQLKELVESNFPTVWVVGEVSGCTRAGSGHYYFTLKDADAQIRAVMWRRTASAIKFEIHDGLEVVAAGPIEVYAARGSYQIVVEELIPRGIGALELAFRQLQERLAAEGLFELSRKRPIPKFPKRIALVTSPTGAAVRDLIQVISRRWKSADIVVVPVPVQGAAAAPEIALALQNVHRIPRVDVVIAGRGGGSLEDLWAFNEEIVARAIAACRIPVISAVGHEIDVSIADLVADRRALTPSEAGELVVPLTSEVRSELDRLRDRLCTGLMHRAARARLRVDAIASRRAFTRPLQRIHDLATKLDDCSTAMTRNATRITRQLRDRLGHFSGRLDALSPLKVLGRGYSITRRLDDAAIVRDSTQVTAGNRLVTILAQGRIVSRVEETAPATAGDLRPVADPEASDHTR